MNNAIKVLNCCSMSPWWPRWNVSAVCLLLETGRGMALVDTGLGLHDYNHPSRLMRSFHTNFGVIRNPNLAAVRQLPALGIAPQDVHDIILTHLHFDHAGGLPDFPHARVHLHRAEYEAMQHRRKWIEIAYDSLDIAHGPQWAFYDRVTDEWLGLPAIRLPFERAIYLVPLFGHTRGHCGVAIRDGDGWLFQCSDALPTDAEFDLTPGWVNRLVLGSHVPTLKAFAAAHPKVRLLAGHSRRMIETF